MLVRHRLQAPPIPTSTSTAPTAATNENDAALPSLVIYSLYMHLLDWAGYQADSTKPRPGVWGKPVFAVAEKANDSRRKHANNPHIPEGGIGTNLRDAAGHYAGFAPRGTQLRLGAASTRRGYFAVEQVVSGQTIPDDIVGALVYKAELTPSTPDPHTDRVVVLDEPVPIAAGDLVGHPGQYQRFIDVNPMSANCRNRNLSHLEVFTGDNVDAFLTQSRAHAARMPDAQKTLLRIDTGAKLTPPPRAKQAPSTQAADGIEVTYPVIVNMRTLKEVHKEEDGTRWFEVTAPAANGQRSGWIREKDHPGISRHHPWEWPQFERIQPDSHAPATLYALHVTQHQTAGPDERDRIQSQGEPAKSGPLYQRLYEHLDQDKDRKLTESELRAGLKKPHLAQALARLIVTHDSEWAGPMSKWDGVDELIPQDRRADWEKEKERIKSLLLWDELKGKHGFPSTPKVHHFHPVGLVANLFRPQRLTVEMLRKIFTSAPSDRLHQIVDEINNHIEEYKLDTALRLTHFFAQVREEVGNSATFSESLNYSPEGLKATFSYFRRNPDEAERYGRTKSHPANQEAIANRAYANRNGNGDIESGDGWKFIGRGLKMTTGRGNYQDLQDNYHLVWPGTAPDFVGNSDLLATARYAVQSAVFFWIRHNLYTIADSGPEETNVDAITRIINRHTNSYAARRAHFTRAWSANVFTDVDN